MAEIARLLRERFTQSEREALVRDLGVNPEDVKLKPETRDDFTWALIDYFKRRDQLKELCAAVERVVEQPRPSRTPGGVTQQARTVGKSAAFFVSVKRIGRSRAALLCVGLLLASCAVFAIVSALRRPSVTAKDPTKSSGILVALTGQSSPRAALAYDELCKKLNALGGASVTCIDLEANGDDLQAKVAELRPSLAVAIEQDATARLIPLGNLADDKLLSGGVRPIDLSRDDVVVRLSGVLSQLSVIAGTGFEPRDAVCIPLPTGAVDPASQRAIDEISLLTVYTRQFVPWCIADGDERALLHRVASCSPRAPDRWLSCELAMYLFAERCPTSPATVAALKELAESAPTQAYQNIAMLKLARRSCDKGQTVEELEAASRMLSKLASQEEPCMTATLSEVATCLVRASASGKLIVSNEEELLKIAAFPHSRFDECGDTSLAARAIAGRAFRRATAGQWGMAAADYEAAYQRHHLDDYLLSWAESRLHEGTTDAVKMASDLLSDSNTKPRPSSVPGAPDLYYARASIRRAVLLWIAGHKSGLPEKDLSELWEQVVSEYSSLGEGDVAIENDEGLAELLGEITGSSRVFECLSKKRISSKTGGGEDSREAMRRCVSH